MSSKPSILRILTFFLFSSIFYPMNALTQESDGSIRGFLTLVSGYSPDFEGSNDYKIRPFTAIVIAKSGYYFQLEGTGAIINLIPNGPIEAGPIFNFRSPRNNKVKDIRIKNMANISGAFEAGGFISYEIEEFLNDWEGLEFRAKLLMDTGNTYKGTILDLSSSYFSFIRKDLFLGASATIVFTDKNYRQKYFGISQNDSISSGLAAFQVKNGFVLKDINITINGNYSITEHWGLFSVASYTRIVGQITDSPIIDIVGNPNQFFIALGLSYQF